MREGDERRSPSSVLLFHLQVFCQVAEGGLVEIVKVLRYGGVMGCGYAAGPSACMKVHHHLHARTQAPVEQCSGRHRMQQLSGHAV